MILGSDGDIGSSTRTFCQIHKSANNFAPYITAGQQGGVENGDVFENEVHAEFHRCILYYINNVITQAGNSRTGRYQMTGYYVGRHHAGRSLQKVTVMMNKSTVNKAPQTQVIICDTSRCEAARDHSYIFTIAAVSKRYVIELNMSSSNHLRAMLSLATPSNREDVRSRKSNNPATAKRYLISNVIRINNDDGDNAKPRNLFID